jgi:hypothetical protein
MSLVADQRTLRPNREIEPQKRRVGIEAFFRRPAQPLHDQAAIVILAVRLSSLRLDEGTDLWRRPIV